MNKQVHDLNLKVAHREKEIKDLKENLLNMTQPTKL